MDRPSPPRPGPSPAPRRSTCTTAPGGQFPRGKKYVNQAYVTVTVKEYTNRPILILGGVVRPGALNLAGRWTLQQAILNAGGLAPGAGKKISVLRTADNGLTDRLDVLADELFVKLNPVLEHPDLPGRRRQRRHSSGGQRLLPRRVRTNRGHGKISSDEKLTFLMMMARVGGLSERRRLQERRANPPDRRRRQVHRDSGELRPTVTLPARTPTSRSRPTTSSWPRSSSCDGGRARRRGPAPGRGGGVGHGPSPGATSTSSSGIGSSSRRPSWSSSPALS